MRRNSRRRSAAAATLPSSDEEDEQVSATSEYLVSSGGSSPLISSSPPVESLPSVSLARAPSLLALDTDAARRMRHRPSDADEIDAFTWDMQAAATAAASPPHALRSSPQIVLQNSGAMVVYDPPAHELVVYQHPQALLGAPSPTNHIDSISGGRGGGDASLSGGGGSVAQLQPFQPFHQPLLRFDHDAADLHAARAACRMCGRPFGSWDAYAADEFEYGDVPSSVGGVGVSRAHFTASDYFRLLAETEQAADARRQHARDGETSREDAPSSVARGSRTRRRPLRTAIITDADGATDADEKTVRPRTRRVAADATPPTRMLRSRSGVHIRHESGPRLPELVGARLAGSPSTEDLSREDAPSSAAASDADAVDECEEVHGSGLSRSSFNSGYYAKFFREDRKLGAGGVGGVYLTHHVLDGVMLGTYAVKKIPVGNSRSWLVQVLREVRALEGLHHRHIVAYKHSWLESFRPSDFGPEVPCLFMLMEYADRGTLANRIWPKTTSTSGGGSAARRAASAASAAAAPPPLMPEEEVWWIFIGTLLGLRRLHRARIIHRDLKPENLLLASETDALGRETGLRVLVSDFGNAILKGVPHKRTGNTGTLAYSAPETLVPQSELAARLFDPVDETATDGAGTGTFAASSPSSSAAGGGVGEMRLPTLAYDEKVDLWSCGVCLYAMAFGALPFSGTSPASLVADIRRQTSRGLVMPARATQQRPPEMIRIIHDLLALNPSERPSIDELLARPAIAQRREAKHRETQRFRHAQATNTSGPTPVTSAYHTEVYRPPPSQPTALVLSPMLTSSVPPRRGRSHSPKPIKLEGPLIAGAPRRRSAGQISTGSLILPASFALDDDANILPSVLRGVRSAIVAAVRMVSWAARAATGYSWLAPYECCFCRWSTSAEAVVHLAAFVLKLWLSLTVLLNFPCASSVYLHVFPEVFLTLSLVATSGLSRPDYLLAASLEASRSTAHTVVAGMRHAYLWAAASALRWHLLRLVIAVSLALLSAGWLVASGSGWAWHALNLLVLVCQVTGTLSTFFAAHTSHEQLHVVESDADPDSRTVVHDALSPAIAPRRSSTVSPTGLDLGPTAHPFGTPVARVPLLLPPTPTPAPLVSDLESHTASRTSRRDQRGTEPTDTNTSRLIDENRRLRG